MVKATLLFLVLGLLPRAAQAATSYGPQQDNTAGFFGVQTTTTACAGTATLVLSSSTVAVGTRFCNEGSVNVRVGGSGITSTIGAIVFAGTCVSLDQPRYWRAALYCVSTGATQASSTMQATP